jgi:hypothetical protein
MTPKLVFDLLQAWESAIGPDNWKTASDVARRKASFANSITWYPDYADGREAPKGIVAANWNDADYYDQATKTRVTYPERIESRLCAVFEKLGVEIEWSDQVSSCGDCGKCIQTSPDSYGWRPAFVVTDGDIFCSECAEDDAESLLEAAEGGVWNLPDIDPTDHGYIALPEEYETGLHHGQTDDPKVVLKALREKGITRALVVVTDVGQFDSRWQIYIHESENEGNAQDTDVAP